MRTDLAVTIEVRRLCGELVDEDLETAQRLAELAVSIADPKCATELKPDTSTDPGGIIVYAILERSYRVSPGDGALEFESCPPGELQTFLKAAGELERAVELVAHQADVVRVLQEASTRQVLAAVETVGQRAEEIQELARHARARLSTIEDELSALRGGGDDA